MSRISRWEGSGETDAEPQVMRGCRELITALFLIRQP